MLVNMKKKPKENILPKIISGKSMKFSKDEFKIVEKTYFDEEIRQYCEWDKAGEIIEVDSLIKEDEENLVLKQKLSHLYLNLVFMYDKRISEDFMFLLLSLNLGREELEIYMILLQELEHFWRNPNQESILKSKNQVIRLIQQGKKFKIAKAKGREKIFYTYLDKLEKAGLCKVADKITSDTEELKLKEEKYLPVMILEYDIGKKTIQLPWNMLRYIAALKNYLYNSELSSFDKKGVEYEKELIGKMTCHEIREQIKETLKLLDIDPMDFLDIFYEHEHNKHFMFYQDLVRITKNGKPTRSFKNIPGYHKHKSNNNKLS